jgi:hypothetical protein
MYLKGLAILNFVYKNTSNIDSVGRYTLDDSVRISIVAHQGSKGVRGKGGGAENLG